MDVILMLVGFVLLVVGGDFLVRASVALSLKFNISKMVIGITHVLKRPKNIPFIVARKAA